MHKYEVTTNGKINYEEFVTMLFKVGTKKYKNTKVQKCEVATNGNINYEEFVAVLFKVKIHEYKKVHKWSYNKW